MAMTFCDAGGCAAFCIGGCPCIASSDDPEHCVCICNEDFKINVKHLKWLQIDTKIDFCSHDLLIGTLAVFIYAIMSGYVKIPPKSVDARITISKKEVSCRELLAECGLLVSDAKTTT
jgi:hypothetical protein